MSAWFEIQLFRIYLRVTGSIEGMVKNQNMALIL